LTSFNLLLSLRLVGGDVHALLFLSSLFLFALAHQTVFDISFTMTKVAWILFIYRSSSSPLVSLEMQFGLASIIHKFLPINYLFYVRVLPHFST
jgi:hypothetical protein